MKIIQAILIFSLSLILFSCDNEGKGNLDFSTVSLKQTQWSGTFEETDKYGTSTANVGLVFYTENEGRYSVVWETQLKNEASFKYSIDEKILTITNTGVGLDGRWLLLKSDKDKMVLEKGTGGEGAYKVILTLTRTN